MRELGRSYELEVIKKVDFGVYLDAQNLGEILLPRRWVPEDVCEGDVLAVFLYLDSEDRPVATTVRPRAEVGECAYLKVMQTTKFGAFLDWGLDKQLLVPFAEQHQPMVEGKSYLVYLYIDPRDDRIVASSKLDKYIVDDASGQYSSGQAVNLRIANSTSLGFKVVVNHRHWGVLYKNEVFQRLSFGQQAKGFVSRVREDGKLDINLNGGRKSRDENTQKILELLKRNAGFSELNDKSNPADISAALAMSKGAFKKALGGLYKQRVIDIEPGGIRLIKADDDS